jgi:hypothetical protein
VPSGPAVGPTAGEGADAGAVWTGLVVATSSVSDVSATVCVEVDASAPITALAPGVSAISGDRSVASDGSTSSTAVVVVSDPRSPVPEPAVEPPPGPNAKVSPSPDPLGCSCAEGGASASAEAVGSLDADGCEVGVAELALDGGATVRSLWQ